MTEEDRARVREKQDRLLEILRKIPLFVETWDQPVWPGMPSPAEMEAMIHPRHEAAIDAAIREVEGA